jgi:transcriptional regulator with XRE-family HTH domain
MEARGWSQAQLADAAGLRATTLSNLLNTHALVPELPTLVKLSTALEVNLAVLLVVAGFPVREAGVTNPLDARRLAVLAAAPWLRALLEQIIALKPADQASVVTYVEVLAQRRHNRIG